MNCLYKNTGKEKRVKLVLNRVGAFLPQKTAKMVIKELSSPHLEYNGIAATQDMIISLKTANSNHGAYSFIKYKDIVWVYAAGGATIILLKDDVIATLPFNTYANTLVIRTKDKNVVVRYCGRGFKEMVEHIVEKCPKETLRDYNEETEIEFCKRTGRPIPVFKDPEYTNSAQYDEGI